MVEVHTGGVTTVHYGGGFAFGSAFHHAVGSNMVGIIIAFILIFGLLIFLCVMCSSQKEDEHHQEEDLEEILDQSHMEII